MEPMTDMNRQPWLNEPIRQDFEAYGYKCQCRRMDELSCWAGYVVLPKGHVVRESGIAPQENEMLKGLRVHGGIDWQGFLPYEKDYLIGFHCEHGADIDPRLEATGSNFRGSTWKGQDFVRVETESLARQLSEL